ncbi:MAG: major capsid protein [Gammaproteobacteria bacterium]|nr:major capsid protein [Gammaproteobacteria bacterium]
MADNTTKVMLRAHEQTRRPTLFLSGMFQSPRENFHDSEEVEIDIVRSEEDIAIAVQTLSAGRRYNQEDLFTNKGYKPPILREAGVISAESLIKRQPGEDPYKTPDFQITAITKASRLSMKLQDKIQRNMEFQASEVLTKGTVTLIDANGDPVYVIDYKPKATHFPDVAIDWGAAGETPAGDIISLANLIRADGLADPNQLIFGENAFENFIKNADIKDRLKQDGLGTGRLTVDGSVGNGAVFQGTIKLGSYRYEMWTYAGRYKNPQTGVSTPFIPTDKVIVRASGGRMDATFGGIPLLGAPDPRVPRALNQRFSVPGRGVDATLNSWIEKDRTGLTTEAMARPLMIPTAIDTYGCIDTNP